MTKAIGVFKFCYMCKMTLNTSMFGLNKSKSDGYADECRKCAVLRQKEYMKGIGKTIRRKYETSPEGIFKRYSLKGDRGGGFFLTFDEFITFWKKPCFYCDDHIQYIGLDRVDNSKPYTLSNVVSCCKTCNIAKNTQSQEEFIERCKRISRRFNYEKNLWTSR